MVRECLEVLARLCEDSRKAFCTLGDFEKSKLLEN